jgi:hypothetical protein
VSRLVNQDRNSTYWMGRRHERLQMFPGPGRFQITYSRELPRLLCSRHHGCKRLCSPVLAWNAGS